MSKKFWALGAFIAIISMIVVGLFLNAPKIKEFFAFMTAADSFLAAASNVKPGAREPIDWSTVSSFKVSDSSDAFIGLNIGGEKYSVKRIERFADVKSFLLDRANTQNNPAYIFKNKSSDQFKNLTALCFERKDDNPLCTLAVKLKD